MTTRPGGDWMERKSGCRAELLSLDSCKRNRTTSKSAARCVDILKLDPSGQPGLSRLATLHEILPWSGATQELPAGHALGEPVILYKKLDAVELFGTSGG